MKERFYDVTFRAMKKKFENKILLARQTLSSKLLAPLSGVGIVTHVSSCPAVRKLLCNPGCIPVPVHRVVPAPRRQNALS